MGKSFSVCPPLALKHWVSGQRPECKHGGLANLRRVGGTHDGGHPFEEVVPLGPGGAVARRIQADLRKLLLDSAAQGERRDRVTQVESENLTRHMRAPPASARKNSESPVANWAGCHIGCTRKVLRAEL